SVTARSQTAPTVRRHSRLKSPGTSSGGENLPVPLFLNTLEQSGLSTWLRESESFFGFYFILVFHTIVLVLVVGPNAAVDLRLLGVAPDIPLPSLRRWFNLMWLGLAINFTSGIFLVLAYPRRPLRTR